MQNAPATRSANMPEPEFYTPQFDLGGAAAQGFSAYYDTQLKQAQIDNVKTQNAVLTQEALLKAAQVVGSGTTNASNAFDLSQKQRLADVSVEMANQQLRKLEADTSYTLDNNERQKAITANTLAQGAESILNSRSQRATNDLQRSQIRAQIELMSRDQKLKDLDIELKKNGFQPSDPLWQRVLGRLLADPQKWRENLDKIYEDLMDVLKGRKVELKTMNWGNK